LPQEKPGKTRKNQEKPGKTFLKNVFIYRRRGLIE
jgi:hypothetical protein